LLDAAQVNYIAPGKRLSSVRQSCWTIVDWDWDEPQQDLLGGLVVIVEELQVD